MESNQIEGSLDVQEILDPDTGFADPDHLTIDDLAATQEVLQTANYLQELQATVGWGIVMGFIGEEVNSLLFQLRKERDLERIRRIQCLIEALELIPNVVEKLKLEAAKAQEVLNQYTLSASEG